MKWLWAFLWGFTVALYLLLIWPMRKIKPEWWAVAKREWYRYKNTLRWGA